MNTERFKNFKNKLIRNRLEIFLGTCIIVLLWSQWYIDLETRRKSYAEKALAETYNAAEQIAADYDKQNNITGLNLGIDSGTLVGKAISKVIKEREHENKHYWNFGLFKVRRPSSNLPRKPRLSMIDVYSGMYGSSNNNNNNNVLNDQRKPRLINLEQDDGDKKYYAAPLKDGKLQEISRDEFRKHVNDINQQIKQKLDKEGIDRPLYVTPSGQFGAQTVSSYLNNLNSKKSDNNLDEHK